MTTDDFFGALKPWSHHKHRILEKYTHVWVYKLQSRSKQLVFVDACAGAGQYASGEDGSPLIAVRWNDKYLRAHGKRLVVVAIEEDEQTLETLRENLRPWSSRTPPEAVVLAGAFQNHIARLVDLTRRIPTFFFIDPFGVRGIEPSALAPLLQASDLKRTEILLRIDPGLLSRASGWLKSKDRDGRQQRTASAFAVLLRRMNISDETLKELEKAEADGALLPGERAYRLLDDYVSLFHGRFPYVQLIPIRASYYSAPRYFLLHATTSADGAAKINDVVSTTEDDLFVEHASARDRTFGQGSLFPPAASERPVRVTIEDAARVALDLMLERQRPHTMIEISADLALIFGPDLRGTQHRHAMKLLRARGAVRFEDPLDDRTMIVTV